MGLRLNRGLSFNELARHTGVSAPSLRLAEAGHVPGPRIQFAVAEFFEVRVTDIWPLPGQGARSELEVVA